MVYTDNNFINRCFKENQKEIISLQYDYQKRNLFSFCFGCYD